MATATLDTLPHNLLARNAAGWQRSALADSALADAAHDGEHQLVCTYLHSGVGDLSLARSFAQVPGHRTYTLAADVWCEFAEPTSLFIGTTDAATLTRLQYLTLPTDPGAGQWLGLSATVTLPAGYTGDVAVRLDPLDIAPPAGRVARYRRIRACIGTDAPYWPGADVNFSAPWLVTYAPSLRQLIAPERIKTLESALRASLSSPDRAA